MSTTRFDLVDITRIIQRRRVFILTVTIVALVIGAVFHLLRQKKYEGKTAFFVSNPIYSDRSTIFAGADSRYTDYFGDEDDIDRVVALAESDTIIMQTIADAHLDEAYKLDMSNPFDRNKMKSRFNKDLEIKRTEYKLIELYFTDKDPVMAASVANIAVRNIEKGYNDFYTDKKLSIYHSIQSKLNEIDSSINALTDTLTKMREYSGIYDILSPSRVNLILGSIKVAGKEQGKYVELIQNYESIKDMLVIDRTRYLSLLNQYATGIAPGQMPLLHVISTAKPPVDPKGPSAIIVLGASLFIGLFFSIAIALLTTYYKELSAAKGK